MYDKLALKDLESNIWKMYVLKILFGFFISVPIIVLFWQQNGLSMFDVMVLQGLFAVAVIILEVPSGYFADRYGRKNTLILSTFFATLGITGYSLGNGFIDFLISETLWAVGISLVSGADSAMFYDTLVELDREEDYKELWGKASSYYMISAGIAAILGGFIAEYSLRWAIAAQIPVFASMIPLAYTLKEPNHHKEVSEEGSKTIKTVLTELLDRKRLRNLILYGAFIYAALQTAFWFYQPYFKLSGLDVAAFGFIFAGFNLVSALSSKYAHTIEESLGKKISLVSLMALVVASLALMSTIVFTFSFMFIMIQQFVRGFSKPVISDYINKIIDSENRSTILSTHSLLGRVFMAVSMPVFGLVSDLYSITQALSLLGVTVFVSGPVFLVLLRSEDVISL